MPKPNDPEVAAETRAANTLARLAGFEELGSDRDTWMEKIMDRFLLETDKQLKLVEKTKAHTVPEQAQHAGTLASLERTLERLAQFETRRASRERKVAMSNDELRAAIKRELDQLAASRSEGEVAP